MLECQGPNPTQPKNISLKNPSRSQKPSVKAAIPFIKALQTPFNSASFIASSLLLTHSNLSRFLFLFLFLSQNPPQTLASFVIIHVVIHGVLG